MQHPEQLPKLATATIQIGRHGKGVSPIAPELRALTDLGCGSVVVQHAAQTLAALDPTCVYQIVHFRANQSVGQTLVIALAVVVRQEALNRCPGTSVINCWWLVLNPLLQRHLLSIFELDCIWWHQI